MRTNIIRTCRPVVMTAVAIALAGGVALAPSASAQVGPPVPPIPPNGCPAVPAGYNVEDYSALPNLGNAAVPHFVPGGQVTYTIATPGQDFIEGNSLNDIICALGSDDTVSGNGGNDVIHGMSGSDTLEGNEAEDEIVGGTQGDILYGDGAVPTLLDTNDRIKGGQGNDVMTGGAGNDDIRGNGDNDTGDGQAGLNNFCDLTVELRINC